MINIFVSLSVVFIIKTRLTFYISSQLHVYANVVVAKIFVRLTEIQTLKLVQNIFRIFSLPVLYTSDLFYLTKDVLQFCFNGIKG